jgi:5-hydroxyisourate hydrolase
MPPDMSAITTHVLDTTRGRPASGVSVLLERLGGEREWYPLGRGETDGDGRVRTLMTDDETLSPGVYRLVFDTGRYFDTLGIPTFYPQVVIVFEAAAGQSHYHVPLLVSPFGYSTYRGS